MNIEENRLQTFSTWPANAAVEPQRVAKAGFFYTGVGLVVECFSCEGRISEWDYGDQVMAKHRSLNPDCPFVKKPTEAGNVPILNANISNVSLYRSGSVQSSDSLQCNPPISIVRNVGEVINANESREEIVPSQESTDSNRDSSSSYRSTGDQRTSFDSHFTSGSSNEDNSMLHEGTPALQFEPDNQMRYRSEAARLETFRTWPKPLIVSPELLAKAGFYYLREEDKVKCAFCSGIVGHWEAGDDPNREHRRHFPSCPLHYNVPVGNIPLDLHLSSLQQFGCSSDNVVLREVLPVSAPDGDERRAVVEHSKSLPEGSDVPVEGIHQHRGPRHPKYSTVESRLRTFKDWPGSLRQTPSQLAHAGFYYTGVNDQVRCFHCDGGLRQWDDSDDPWVEHARWFPKCIYVVLMKGEEFIQQVASQHPPILPTDDAQGKGSQQVTGTTNSSPYKVRNVSEEELNGLMNTIPVQMAIGVGLDVSKIRYVLRQKMEQTGLPFTTSDALIGAVLDMSSNSSSSHSPESPTPGPSQEYHGDQDNASLQQNLCGKNAREDEEKMQRASHLASSQPVPSLSQAVGVHMVGQVNVLTSQSYKTENSDDGSAALLAEENRRLKEARLCKICMDEEVGVVFLPCGHLVTCINCTPSLQDCPLCRQPIKATVRTFLS